MPKNESHPTQAYCSSGDFFYSEAVIVFLGRKIDRVIGVKIVIALFRPHIEYEPDGQEVEIGNADADLNAPEHEQRGRHFPLGAAPFF